MTENEFPTLTQGLKEFGGKTVEHAIEIACRYFGVATGDLEIKILNRGSTGIFGLGGHEAKIKAIPKKKRPPVTKKNQKKRGESLETKVAHPIVPEVPAPKDTEVAEKTSKDLERHISLAKEIAEGLLKRAGLKGQAEIKIGEEGPYLDISGDDLSLIIGKEGQNLDALEYIVNRILQHRDKNHSRVNLEAQGYREKREKGLSLLAHRMAKKVQRTGQSIALQPLGPKERRTVHLALKGVKGIHTRSVGDGIMRKVVISPPRRTVKPHRCGPKDSG